MDIKIVCNEHGNGSGGIACRHIVDEKAREVFITKEGYVFCEYCYDRQDVLHIDALLPVCDDCLRRIVHDYVDSGTSVNGIEHLFSLQ